MLEVDTANSEPDNEFLFSQPIIDEVFRYANSQGPLTERTMNLRMGNGSRWKVSPISNRIAEKVPKVRLMSGMRHLR